MKDRVTPRNEKKQKIFQDIEKQKQPKKSITAPLSKAFVSVTL